jgi:hypothetical protein
MQSGGKLGIRVARGLYARWRVLAPAERQRLAALAQSVKDRAFELRGSVDSSGAERKLRHANEELAGAIVDSARSDPEVGADELQRLRDDLARELARLASGEVRASRAGHRDGSPAARGKPGQ